MNFIKTHWYGLLMSILFGCYMLVFFYGLIWPENYADCTLKMSEEIKMCEGKIWCSFKGMLQNMLCEIKVFFKV